MSRLLDAAGDAPFVFVTGKGGVGKTTAAGALSLEMADCGSDTLLISTDPAHSLADLFRHPAGGDAVTSLCSHHLSIEEFDAVRMADAWLEGALGSVAEIVERGTYLDAEDVNAFSRLALPGIDEMMAVLRLVDVADAADGPGGTRRIVVDTAPTGHTLRLLDAAATHEGIARALRAMADKATAVAGAMTGRAARMAGEDVIERLDHYVATWRERVLAPAAFVVVTRSGAVIEAETRRLAGELEERRLRIAAVLSTGSGVARAVTANAVRLRVPLLDDVSGCTGLRAWRERVEWAEEDSRAGPGDAAPAIASGPVPQSGGASGPGPKPEDWLAATAPRLLLFAGKGGVGKSTCAAAAALGLARTRDVLLCSTDPAGSLSDVLGSTDDRPAERLRVMQIAPAAQLERLRDTYREEVVAALDRLGLSQSAALDRRVIESLWDLAPPGLDELASTAAMLSASTVEESVVVDSSPTGHFLRLLEMPEVALGWTRQLMRVFVKYGIAGVAGGAAESLLELSRELRRLRDMLHDAGSACVIVVTLDEPMVRAETERLVARLQSAGIRVGAVVLNRSAVSDPAAQQRTSGSTSVDTLIVAPALEPPPVGADALRRFLGAWNIPA